jgi:putative ATP-binding cassette transporter
VVGGNGSGKTTLAKILLGLYQPEAGELSVDGVEVTDENRDTYRQLFSATFSDFFLFDSLLGLDQDRVDESAARFLSQLRLERKVKVEGGRFSTLDLSQGQRKRLALLTAYLENRAIYLFDEWAADQDPYFKRIFYKELIPNFQRCGKTILVISHDEQFYELADRLIKLDSGRIVYDGPAGAILGAAAAPRPEPVGELVESPVLGS